MEQQYSSELFEKAVDEFAKLPGIGRKTATRLVLHMLRLDTGAVDNFGQSITNLRHNVKYCKICHNISDTDVCGICSNPSRDSSTGICHVPVGKVSFDDQKLVENYAALYTEILRVKPSSAKGRYVKSIALSSTMEGDTTNFYIFRKLAGLDVRLSVIARGISVGDELEYTDEVTLGRSILNRTVFTGVM